MVGTKRGMSLDEAGLHMFFLSKFLHSYSCFFVDHKHEKGFWQHRYFVDWRRIVVLCSAFLLNCGIQIDDMERVQTNEYLTLDESLSLCQIVKFNSEFNY